MGKQYTARDVREALWVWDERALTDKDAAAIARSWSNDGKTEALLRKYRSVPYFRKLPFRLRYLHAVKRPMSKIVFLLSDEQPRMKE